MPVSARTGGEPLADAADPRLYMSRSSSEAVLAGLERWLRGVGGLALVAGPPGAGTTLVLRVLEQSERRRRRVLFSPFLHFEPDALERWLIALAPWPPPGRARAGDPLLTALGLERGAALPPLLLVDEAHAAARGAIEALGRLVRSRAPSLRVVLAGCAGRALREMEDAFGARAAHFELAPWTPGELRALGAAILDHPALDARESARLRGVDLDALASDAHGNVRLLKNALTERCATPRAGTTEPAVVVERAEPAPAALPEAEPPRVEEPPPSVQATAEPEPEAPPARTQRRPSRSPLHALVSGFSEAPRRRAPAPRRRAAPPPPTPAEPLQEPELALVSLPEPEPVPIRVSPPKHAEREPEPPTAPPPPLVAEIVASIVSSAERPTPTLSRFAVATPVPETSASSAPSEESAPLPTLPPPPAPPRRVQRTARAPRAGSAGSRFAYGLTVAVAVLTGSAVGLVAGWQYQDEVESPAAPVAPPAAPEAVPAAPAPEPEVAAAPPLEPEAPRWSVHVNAQPWAWIHVDGKALGATPLVSPALSAGPHEFEAVFPDGRRERRVVEIGPDSRFVAFR